MVKQVTKHDHNHRKTASVTMHGYGQLAPNQQWEVNINPTPDAVPNSPRDAFNPMGSKNRPRTHVKVNECDY